MSANKLSPPDQCSISTSPRSRRAPARGIHGLFGCNLELNRRAYWRNHMIGSLLITAATVLVVAPPSSAQEFKLDRETSTVLDRAIIVPKDQLALSRLLTSYKAYLSKIPPAIRIARITLGTSDEAVRSALLPVQFDNSYASAAADIADKKPVFPIARIFVSDGAVRLTYRDSKGLIDKLVAGTHDPIQFQVNDTTFRLLHLWITPSGPAVKPPCSPLTLYFQASPTLSMESSRVLINRLAQLTNSCHLSVDIRNDPWFFEATHFPFASPLFPDLRPSNELQYKRGAQVSCGFISGRPIVCTGQNFRR